MRRLPNWVARLDGLLADNGKRPFAYGQWDCCLFVCAAIEAITGTHPAMWLTDYDTEAGGIDLASAHFGKPITGVAEMVAIVAADRGMKQVPIGMAKRGDLIVFRQQSGEACCGIVSLNGMSLMVVTESGLRSYPIAKLSSPLAWNVG